MITYSNRCHFPFCIHSFNLVQCLPCKFELKNSQIATWLFVNKIVIYEKNYILPTSYTILFYLGLLYLLPWWFMLWWKMPIFFLPLVRESFKKNAWIILIYYCCNLVVVPSHIKSNSILNMIIPQKNILILLVFYNNLLQPKKLKISINY